MTVLFLFHFLYVLGRGLSDVAVRVTEAPTSVTGTEATEDGQPKKGESYFTTQNQCGPI